MAVSTITIDFVTTTGYYTIYVCNTSLDYCELIGINIPIPPEFSFVLPEIFQGVQEIVVRLIDQNDNCEDFNYYNCVTATPTPSVTPTITPSKTIVCNCLTFQNTGVTSSLVSYTGCNGTSYSYYVPSGDTYFACGRLPSYGVDINFTLGDECINNSCPPIPITPSVTQTPSPTLPSVVGYFESCCDTNYKFVVAGIPQAYSALTGTSLTFAIKNLGFEGCATSTTYFSSNTIFSNILIAQTDDCTDCQLADQALICPTSTKSPTPTPTITPSISPTTGLALTQTPTNTPTASITPTCTLTPSSTQSPCVDCWIFTLNSGDILLSLIKPDGSPANLPFSYFAGISPLYFTVSGGTIPYGTPNPAGRFSLSKFTSCIGCP